MLTTQLVVRLQPVVEQLRTGLHNFQWLQRDAMRTLGLVVAVEFLQAVVEQARKFVKVLRLASKLDEPLVATVGMLVHEHRCSSVFAHLGAGLFAGIGESALGVVHDEFLAEGIDEILRAAGDDELIWILLREHHRVANHIAPQSTRGGDHHRIVLARLHAPERYNLRSIVSIRS